MSRQLERAPPLGQTHAPAGTGVLGFVLRFGVFWALALGILSQVPALERWAVDTTVTNLALVLRAIAADTIVSGNTMHTEGVSIEIVPDCTPLMPTLVFWAGRRFPAPGVPPRR